MKDYDYWERPVHRWPSARAFLDAEELPDGIHAVSLSSGTVLDILLEGEPLGPADTRHVLTFFSGAVQERQGRKGPYFSGLGMSKRLDMPIIAVSDPGLDADPDVRLAWYAGNLRSRFQDELSELLRGLAARSGRPLLLAGGSGGGFAALAQAERLRELATVVVWNPQTSILHYNPASVRKWLRTLGFAVGFIQTEDWIPQVTRRVNGRIQLSLRGSGALESARGVLYLQNWSDSHRRVHLLPWLNWNRWLEMPVARAASTPASLPGAPVIASSSRAPQAAVYSLGRNHAVVVAEFTEGHGTPPRGDLVNILGALQNGTASPQQLGLRFAKTHA
ncbi:hypothetical protein [Zhihengliuella alba]